MNGSCNSILFWPRPLGPWGGVKYHLTSITKIVIPNFVRVLTNIDIKHIEQGFHSVAWVMPKGLDIGVLVVKTFSVGICNGAPSTAHSS